VRRFELREMSGKTGDRAARKDPPMRTRLLVDRIKISAKIIAEKETV
jgi:hypothetical protein